MSGFSLSSALSALRTGLSVVQTLAPLATAVGAPAGLVEKVFGIAGAVLDTAQTINQRVEEGHIIATSNDQDQLKALVAGIQAENDELDRFIDAN
jgi:hypothetical protein